MFKRKMMFFLFLFATVSLVFLPGCLSQKQSIEFDGRTRTFITHLPSRYDNTALFPLVIVLHGGAGNGLNAEQTTGMSTKADEKGFIVVYPDGTGILPNTLLTWNAGFCCGYALENAVDDVGFIQALITHFKSTLSVDPERIYVTGISNGGMMTYRLGAELSNELAGIAPVAASIAGKATESSSLWKIPSPEKELSVIAFNGMLDGNVPYDGGQPTAENTKGAYSYLSVDESISFWVENNNCSPTPVTDISNNGNIITDTYSEGDNNTEVVLYSIADGKHAWPGGRKGLVRS
jgi:polyhydroxybutyrate depolymerase